MSNLQKTKTIIEDKKWDLELEKDSNVLDILGIEALADISEDDYKDEQW